MWANIGAIFSARKSLHGHSKCTKMQGPPILFQGKPAYYIRGGGNPPSKLTPSLDCVALKKLCTSLFDLLLCT